MTPATESPTLTYDQAAYYACRQLLGSQLFRDQTEYILRQLIHSLEQVCWCEHDTQAWAIHLRIYADQEDEWPVLYIIAVVLLQHGSSDDNVFILIQDENLFSRMADLIRSGRYNETVTFRPLLDLFCSTTKVQKLERDDLGRHAIYRISPQAC